MGQHELLFGAAADPGHIFATLSTRYQVHVEPTVDGRWMCLDTADWRLHRANMTLRDSREGRRAQLVLSADGNNFTASSSRLAWPRRAEGLPASAIRDLVAPAIGVRALLPLAEVNVRSMTLRILDNDEKTRVRVRVDQQRLAGANNAPLPLRVLVTPLRGYDPDGLRCESLLTEAMTPLPGETNAAEFAMAAAGHVPGQPPVVPPHLDPNRSAVESLTDVLRHWADVIDAVRAGVLADVDIEYLHEMRTAVRATRSMLTLGGHLLPVGDSSRFADEFRWLGKLTASVRDVDVALLELEGRGELDISGIEHLEPVQAHLATRRRSALRTLRTAMESPRGRSLTGEWRDTLGKVEAPEVPDTNTRETAAEQARVAYRRIIKAAGEVHTDTPADDLHRLRRRCKRMRYLLDGYESVYAPVPHRELLGALKKLQDCLGDIQDVDVQRAELADLATSLTRRGASTDVVLAIGALRDRSLRRDTAARAKLLRQLNRFRSAETRAAVRALGADAA